MPAQTISIIPLTEYENPRERCFLDFGYKAHLDEVNNRNTARFQKALEEYAKNPDKKKKLPPTPPLRYMQVPYFW